jgi:hypothetical protein
MRDGSHFELLEQSGSQRRIAPTEGAVQRSHVVAGVVSLSHSAMNSPELLIWFVANCRNKTTTHSRPRG